MDTVSMLNKMSFYCQPILPLVYDESMSYYETLCKVVGQLNTTGETVNKLNEGLTGEIADRQAADAELDERLKLVEATNAKIHFLIFDGANPNGGFPTRSELYQWVHEGDAIFTLFRTNEDGRGQIYAASCSYNAGNWGSEASNDFNIIVPIETSYDATQDYAVKQKVAKLSIPLSPQTNLNVPWRLQIIESNIPSTSAEGVVNLVAVINDSDSVNCSITPSEFLGLYNTTRGGKNLCVAVNAKLSYDGLARSSSVATVDTNNRKIRIAFERDGGVYTENGVKQLNKTLDYIIGDASTNVWTHETIDSKTFDFSRFEGFQFTRGAHNVITTDDESTPNAVYTQYHANESGKFYQNLPTRLIDTIDNAEYWNGVFDIKDGNHMTFTFVTSNYVAASDKMLVRVIELSADVNTTAWKYGEKEFTIPLSDSDTLYVDFWPLGTEETYNEELKAYVVELASNQTFDAIFDSINAGHKTVARLYQNEDKSGFPDSSVDVNISGNKTIGTINFHFLSVDASNIAGFAFIGEVITLIKTSSSTLIFISLGANALPVPNGDGTDNGKVPTVNGTRWEMKKPKEDFVVTITVPPSPVPTSVNGGIAQFTVSCDKTFDEIKAAIDAGKNVFGKYANNIWPLSYATDTMVSFAGVINFKYFEDASNASCIFTIQSNETSIITCAAGELPAPALDGSDNGKVPTVNGTRWEMKKPVVDDALSDTSTNPVQNKVVTKALNGKASTEVASETANGLMSAEDKKKLNGIEAGANKTIVDEMLSDGSTNPVQNKVVTAALATVVRESIYPITVTATSAEWVVDNGIAYKEASSDRTFDDIKAAHIGNKTPVCEFEGMTYSLILDSSTAFIFASYRGAVANDSQYAGLGKYPTSLITINTTGVVISRTAGDLPAVGGTDNGKMLIVAGGEWALQRVPGATVDAELSTTSENPVQNKTVTDALNGKLPKTGGTVTGALRTNDSFSAGGTIAFGEAPIGLSQTADGAAEIRSGSADVDDNPPPLSRLKVARPTADDDAATKKYVDDRNEYPQFKGYVTLTPADENPGTGVGLSPTRDGNNYALDISDVNEGTPTLLTGVKTPTDANTNAAATVEYVNAKVAGAGSPNAVLYTAQTLTDEQKKQARENVDAAIADYVVNGTVNSDRTVTIDKTFAQIQEAVQGVKKDHVRLLLTMGNSTFVMPIVVIASNAIGFQAEMIGRGNTGQTVNVTVTANGSTLTLNVGISLDSNGNLPQIKMAADPTEAMQIATKKYVDDHLGGAPIKIKLGTGNAATSTATFAEIKAALEAGKAPILDSAAGTSHWFALNWVLSGTDILSIQYGTFNVEGGGLANFTFYDVSVSSTGITYASRQFTTE